VTYRQLREKWLKFYEEKNHAIIQSSGILPDGDASVLFINSGMHPLVPYLMGQKHPLGKRLANIQKCIRTGDIDEVGDNTHITFFEMMGNWSLGDYFKKDKIKWSWEFVTGKEWLDIPPEKIAVTVFEGDDIAPRDEESAKLWHEVGVPKDRIFYLGKSENWWQLPSGTGPCGPCSEVYYDTGKKSCGKSCNPACNCGKFVEIGNDVFMEFIIDKVGEKPRPAVQKNVDTGFGLERILCLINGHDNVYDSELFTGALEIIGTKCKAARVIAEHTRAAIVLIADGVVPNNTGQGYVLRRLIRRAVRYANQLKFNNFQALITCYTSILGEFYPELNDTDNITRVFTDEVEKFERTLERGLREFNKLKELDGKVAFRLYETFGFPLEFTQELAAERGVTFSIEEFNNEKNKHTKMSQTASAGSFKGGLADTTGETTRLHTANHLLLEVLRRNFGKSVFQKGSNITPERLRFDFTLDHKMTDVEIKKIEREVNELINLNLPVTFKEMSPSAAEKIGAIGTFGARYGDIVKVFFVGDQSIEICGGPHIANTSELGKFIIQKEESAGTGIRRIKAILD